MRGRKSGQAGSREDDVLEVASRHLNTMGVSAEWFGAIASELRVSRPALYNFALDRGDLHFKCYSRSCGALEAALSAANAASGDPVTVLDLFLTATGAADQPELAVLNELDALPDEPRAEIVERRDAIASKLAAVIDHGVAQRIFRPVNTKVVSHAVLGMASWAPIHRRWTAGRRLAPDASGVRDLLFRGLAADPRAPIEKLSGLTRPKPGRLQVFDRDALHAARYEAILAAASNLFNHKGMGATRIEDVGAALGLSKRAILHHFGSKDALIDACVARTFQLNLATMDAAMALPCSRLEATYAAVCDVIEAASDPESSSLLLHVGFGLLSPAGRRAATAESRRLTDGYRQIITEGQREGSIRDLAVDDIVQSLPAVFTWAARARAPTFPEPSSIADELATLTVLGILA